MREPVITYARKSPDDNLSTEQSIANQDKLFDRKSEEKKWKIEKRFYDLNISGSDRNRKGLKQCIEYVKFHGIKIIMVKDQSRFMRDSSFFMDTIKNLASEGILVYSCKKDDYLNIKDLGTRIMANVDEQKIYDGQKDAELTMERLKSENKPIGRWAFGYKPIKKKYTDKHGKSKIKVVGLKINPKKADIVRKVIEHHKSKKPLKSFLKCLRINKSLYYRIIKSYNQGIYHGYVVYFKKVKNADGFIVRKDQVKYKGNFEPIFKEGDDSDQ